MTISVGIFWLCFLAGMVDASRATACVECDYRVVADDLHDVHNVHNVHNVPSESARIPIAVAVAVAVPVRTRTRSRSRPRTRSSSQSQTPQTALLERMIDARGGSASGPDCDDTVDVETSPDVDVDVDVDTEGEINVNDDQDKQEDTDNEASDTNDASDATTVATIASQTPANSQSEALELRLAGKEAHDGGDFQLASELFQKAADSLQLQLKLQLQLQSQGTPNDGPPVASGASDEAAAAAEEYATCRLHQALCYLKSKKYDQCLQTCSKIIDDKTFYTSAVRARAYHRRAKAKLALQDKTGALQDARAAAFLGDRKAVALYGRLMRDTPYSNSDTSSSTSTLASTSMIDDLFSRQSSSQSSSSLLESLIAKSPVDPQAGGNPASLLINSLPGDAPGSGLANSVIKSLAKRLDDDDTLLMISSFLQRTNSAQLNQFASMAGMDVPQNYLDRIESICHRITPKTVKRTVISTKLAIYVVRIFRRLTRLAQKYKSLLVIFAILQWTKSAILRPIPVDRAAARRQAKVALKDAMKANR